jgi:uncharacterized protein with GYD domain
MKKIYIVNFNEVVMLKSSTKKGATDFMKSLNKKHERIKSIVAKIEKDGGQVFNTVYVERHEGDYIYPIAQKGI